MQEQKQRIAERDRRIEFQAKQLMFCNEKLRELEVQRLIIVY